MLRFMLSIKTDALSGSVDNSELRCAEKNFTKLEFCVSE